MFATSGKKEIWLGTSNETDEGGHPQLEISWGRDGKNTVVIPFDTFVDDILGQYERGGPNTGGGYDDEVINVFTLMIDTLKFYRKHAKKRNELLI